MQRNRTHPHRLRRLRKPLLRIWHYLVLAGLSLLMAGWLHTGLIREQPLLAVALPPASPIASNVWAQASFPVTEFAAYSSPWGWRTDPFTGARKLHRGLDIAGPEGSPILAWWAGTVITVASQPSGCGNYVLIRSGNWEHLYCHNQAVLVHEGDTVQTGQIIARLGSTGRSSGPHCHFELWFNDQNLDPATVLRAMYQAQHPIQHPPETPVSYQVPPLEQMQLDPAQRSLD